MGEGQGTGRGDSDEKSLVALICALFLPPIAVAYVQGCGSDLIINILLTVLGYLPGILHAFWVVLKKNN